LFQFDIYDEYVFNAIAFIRHLIWHRVVNISNITSLVDLHDEIHFESLHGYARTDAAQNVLMYFSLWDFDPDDRLFHPTLEQADPPRAKLIQVGGRAIHWPGNGQPPAPDYCAFHDCSTGTVDNTVLH